MRGLQTSPRWRRRSKASTTDPLDDEASDLIFVGAAAAGVVALVSLVAILVSRMP